MTILSPNLYELGLLKNRQMEFIPAVYIVHLLGTECYSCLEDQKFFIWKIVFSSILLRPPFFFMLVLYPVIIVKLAKQKIPGNSSSQSQVKKKEEKNARLTKMLITIIAAQVLTYGT